MNKEMKCSKGTLRRILAFAVLLLAIPSSSWSHGIAGKRFFPTTFKVDDPFISDEFSILFNHVKLPGEEPNRASEINIDYSKRILPNFGLEFHDAYLFLGSDEDGSANGWENLEVGAKWQFLTNAEHEAILSIGTDVEIGGTGARQVSESFSTISPAFFFGKGLGDLPESVRYLRPFAITGVVGPNLPTRSGEPNTLSWEFTLQYSLMYLESYVKDIGLGAPFNRMIIVAEFPMQTCMNADCNGQTIGTVNPGVIWAVKYVELGVAAQIPVNSRSGNNVGVLALFHLFIDDLFPKSLGRPIFP
jgi:hypothetical protein